MTKESFRSFELGFKQVQKISAPSTYRKNTDSQPRKIPKISSPSSSTISEEHSEPVFIHSFEIIKDITASVYKPYFPGFKENLRISLEYPKPGYREKFYLTTAFVASTGGVEEDAEEYDPFFDIIESVKAVASCAVDPDDVEKFGNDDFGLLRKLKRAKNIKDGELFLEGIREYNGLVREIRSRGGFRKNERPTFDLLEHIIYQCYARVVSPDADRLTNYEAFSNQVYGEVNASLVDEFIKLTNINDRTLFLDMGCGIGNVVLQVGAQTGCRSYGIEIMELPSVLSKYQHLELKSRSEMYQIPPPRIKFFRGDFLNHPEIDKLLPKADVLLINNYVFDSTLNLKIMELFLKMKDGCQVISLKSFAPLDVKVNSRNAGEPESILRVKKYDYCSDSVSWTANPGHFYIHTVDRRPLQRFLESVGK